MSSVHEQTLKLMPWYLNGTLAADDRAALEQHLGECLSCRAALRQEQQLASLVASQDASRTSPKQGISSLLTRIDGGSVRRRPAVPWPAYATALATALAAIAIGGIWLAPARSPPGSDPSPYTTLTNSAGTADTADTPASAGAGNGTTDTESAAGTAGDRIDIVFNRDLDERAIEELIRGFGGRLVSGPSDVGRYTVAVPGRTPAEVTGLLERLAANRDVSFAGRNYIEPPDPGSSSPESSPSSPDRGPGQ